MRSSPAPCARWSENCSSHRDRSESAISENVTEKAPPQPTMLPATCIRGPISRPSPMASRTSMSCGELAVAVAEVGHAVLQVHLRGFESDLRPALPVEDRVLLPVLPEPGAVEARVHVRVDEAGREELPRPVDDSRSVRHRDRGARPHRDDAGAFHHDRRFRKRLAPVPIDDRSPNDGNRLLGGSLRGCHPPNDETDGE